MNERPAIVVAIGLGAGAAVVAVAFSQLAEGLAAGSVAVIIVAAIRRATSCSAQIGAEDNTSARPDRWEYGFWCFLAGCVSLPWLNLRLPGGTTLSDLFLILACVTVASSRQTPPAVGYRVRQLERLAIAFVAWVSLSAVVNGLNPSGLGVVARLLFLLVLWPWLGLSVLRTPTRTIAALAAFALGCAVSALSALSWLAIGHGPGLGAVNGRYYGLTGHPNDFGATCAVGLVAVLALLPSCRLTAFLAMGGLAAAMATGVVLSGSVTSLMALGVGALVLGVAFYGRSEGALLSRLVRRSIMGVACVAGLLLVGPKVSDGSSAINRALAIESGQATLQTAGTQEYRALQYQVALESVHERPFFGAGPSAEDSVVSVGLFNTGDIHNLILRSAHEAGLIGAVFLVLLLFHLVRSQIEATRRSYSRAEWRLGCGLFALNGAALVLSLFQPILIQRYFWFSAVLSVAHIQRVSAARSKTEGPAGVPSIAGTGES